MHVHVYVQTCTVHVHVVYLEMWSGHMTPTVSHMT